LSLNSASILPEDDACEFLIIEGSASIGVINSEEWFQVLDTVVETNLFHSLLEFLQADGALIIDIEILEHLN